MRTSEIYEKVMAVALQVTGFTREEILRSNQEEHADARFLLVMALARMLSDSEIARLMGLSRKGVAYIRSCDFKLGKWLVGKNWEEMRKLLDMN